MRKQAILIASRKEGEEDMDSFKNDVTFLKSFLKSQNGGLWLDSEITTLIYPTYKKLLSAFKENVDYRFIYYSGHGALSDNDQQYIYVDEKAISINILLNKVEREVAIFDCCRTFISHAKLKMKFPLKEFIAKSNPLSIKRNYEKFISNNSGQFIAFVTEKRNFAYTTGTDHSHFMTVFELVLSYMQFVQLKGVVSINKFLRQIDKQFKRFGLKQKIKVINRCKHKYPFYIG